MTITEPGLYGDLDEATYHNDTGLAPTLGRSLSSSGAKTILDCPARYKWERENPVHKDAYDLGSAVHAYILGVGEEQIVEVKADSWRGKDAQEAKEAAHAERKAPLLTKDVQAAKVIANAVLSHPVAAAILAEGKAEQSLYWIDAETGVTCRGRIDWLRSNAIVDVKTARKYGARPESIGKASADYGYAQQAEWYQRGVAAITGDVLPFIHIFVETEAPHIVTIGQLDDEAMDIGRRLNDKALALFAECESSGNWPGYSDDITTISLPRWYANTNR